MGPRSKKNGFQLLESNTFLAVPAWNASGDIPRYRQVLIERSADPSQSLAKRVEGWTKQKRSNIRGFSAVKYNSVVQ